MKITSLTLLLLICAVSLYSQKIQTELQQSCLNNEWQDRMLATYTYDSKGLVATKTWHYREAADSTWVTGRMATYTYDGNNTVQQELSQSWNAADNSWQNTDRSIYTCLFPSHLVISEIYQRWVNGSWQNNYRIIYTTDKKGHLTKDLRQKWDPIASEWVNETRKVYSCHSNGKVDHWTGQDWETTTRTWRDWKYRLCYSYDKSGRDMGNSFKVRINNRWRTNTREITSYDEQGHKVSTVSHRRDIRRSWIVENREDYTNNSDGSVSYYIIQDFDGSGGALRSKVKWMYTYY